MISLTLASPAQTRKLARVLAAQLRPPALVTVEGDLGTGKTTLVREVLRARGVRGAVTSPSFTLAQSYHGRRRRARCTTSTCTGSAAAPTWSCSRGTTTSVRTRMTFVEWPAAGSDALPPADLRARAGAPHAHQSRREAARGSRRWRREVAAGGVRRPASR